MTQIKLFTTQECVQTKLCSLLPAKPVGVDITHYHARRKYITNFNYDGCMYKNVQCRYVVTYYHSQTDKVMEINSWLYGSKVIIYNVSNKFSLVDSRNSIIHRREYHIKCMVVARVARAITNFYLLYDSRVHTCIHAYTTVHMHIHSTDCNFL